MGLALKGRLAKAVHRHTLLVCAPLPLECAEMIARKSMLIIIIKMSSPFRM